MSELSPFVPRSTSSTSFSKITHIVYDLQDLFDMWSFLTVSDFCSKIGIDNASWRNCYDYGWTDLTGMNITYHNNFYTLEMPEPIKLKEEFDPSKYELTIRIKGDSIIEMEISDSLRIKNPGYKVLLRKDASDFNKAYDYAFNRISKECERRRHESIS